MIRKSVTTLAAGVVTAVLLAATPSPTLAHGGGPSAGPMGMMGMGPGMMHMGPGMMGGMGPMAMMRGMGPGMMQGMTGMGPGMMGGMGPGMMQGMMGMGHMGLGAIWMLDLSDDQRAKLHKIKNDLRKQNWSTMGKMMDEQARLQELFGAERRDPKAIGAVYGRIFDLKRQMIEARIEATNRMQDLLTQEQREQLKQWRRGPRAGMGYRGGMPQGQRQGMMGG